MGQTFCIRVMFTGFMLDASNIIKFEKPGIKTISMEWSIFKPQKNGQQVKFKLYDDCNNLKVCLVWYFVP